MDLVWAIEHAMKICHWQENLMNEEIPPSWMWPLDHELESWFEEVEEKRKARYGGSGDDDGPDTPMTKNELADQIRGS